MELSLRCQPWWQDHCLLSVNTSLYLRPHKIVSLKNNKSLHIVLYWFQSLQHNDIVLLSCHNIPIILMHNWDQGRLLCLLFLIRRICYHWQWLDTVITQLSVSGGILLTYQPTNLVPHTRGATWLLFVSSGDYCLYLLISPLSTTLPLHHNIFCAELRPNQVSNVKTCHGELSWN